MIKLNKLQKNYKDFSLDVTMEIPAGTVTGLVGRNGAGKTTVIKAILGLIRTDGGEITVFGKNPRELTAHDKEALSAVLYDSWFPLTFRAKDIACVLRKMYPSFDETRFFDLCKRFEVPVDKRLEKLSSGTRAKLHVLSAICHNAKLLVLDEPTVGLDVVARNDILDMLREYLAQDSERSLLITSHISSDLEGLCDNFYVIDHGIVLLHEDTDTLLGQYGIIKGSVADIDAIDQSFIMAKQARPYGYDCLTNEKQYYLDNYPNLIVEPGTLDGAMMILLGGQ